MLYAVAGIRTTKRQAQPFHARSKRSKRVQTNFGPFWAQELANYAKYFK